jgi:hypothetical protein
MPDGSGACLRNGEDDGQEPVQMPQLTHSAGSTLASRAKLRSSVRGTISIAP